MSSPHSANLFAVHDVEPRLADIAADLAASGEFAEVWRPAPGWVVGSMPLPRSSPDPVGVRESGLLFAEGRDVIADFQRLSTLTDQAPKSLASFPGDFGFIRFRPRGEATFVRSCGGLVPFYFSQSGQRIAIGTRLGDFVRFLPDEPRLDPLVNAIWMTGYGLFPDGRTFLAGVSILERGCFGRVRVGRIDRGRYWDPRPQQLTPPSPQREREHAERLRALLIRKLERELDPEGGNLLTLSGGVDSSSLGALAAGTVGRRVWTWSLLPAPDDLYAHEMSYIAPLAERFGFERRWEVRITQKTRFDLLRAGPSVVFHVAHPALCALPAILAEAPVRVLFGGEFADEVCGSVCTIPDWAAHTPLRHLLRAAQSLPTGPRDRLQWFKHRLRHQVGRPAIPFPHRLPRFVREDIHAEYAEWLERCRRKLVRDIHPLRYLGLRAEMDGFVPMNWEATSALGIRRLFPFFHREVLELASECHPAELVGPGTKKLLRAALRDDVPRQTLYRSDKGPWGRYLQTKSVACDEAMPDLARTVVSEDRWPARSLLCDYADARALTQLVVFCEAVSSWHTVRFQARPPAMNGSWRN